MKNSRDADDFCQEILDQMIEGCQVIGADGRYRYLNDVAARQARRPKDELLGRRMTEVFPGIEQTPMFEKLAVCLKEGTAGELVNEFSYPDGSSAWFELRFRPISAGLLVLSLDITENRQASEAVRNAALFPLENPFPVLRISRDGSLLFSNRAAAALLAEWLPEGGGKAPGPVRKVVETALADNLSSEFEVQLAGRDFSFVVAPIADRDYANLYGRDITENKRAEAGLQIGLQRFELLAWTAGELLRATEPQKVVDSLCRKVMAQLDCHAFFNFLVDEAVGRLHLNACAGIPDEETRKIEWLDYGVAVCGCVARDSCRIVAERIPSTPDERTELVKSYGIKAYACHPLLGQEGQLVGTLSFGTRSRETFNDDDLSLMKAVADQVAVAMIRMRNKQALRVSEERYRHLVEKLQLQNEEIRRRNEELERFNRAVVGREERMIELKQEVNALAQRLGEPVRYPLEFLGTTGDPAREG